MRRLVAMVTLLLAAACESPLAIEGAQRFTPDPDWGWRALYDSAEACTGLEGDFDRITWFEADRIRDAGEGFGGLWKEGHRIYLIRPDVFDDDARGDFKRATVHHEMIHDVTKGAGHDHPAFRSCDRT